MHHAPNTHILGDICFKTEVCRGGSRILGKGGLIKIFTTRGGYRRGVPLPVTARGSGGALIAPPVGPGVKLQLLFCFCIYLA